MLKKALILGTLLLSQCSPLTSNPQTQENLHPLPASFCYLDSVAPQIKVELAYAGPHNFVGRPLDGYQGQRAILRRDTAQGMKRAAEQAAQEGYGIILYDAYRPRRTMSDIGRWIHTSDKRMQTQFYPNISKKQIIEHRYLGEISEHSWGIAVDISLYQLSNGQVLDMGGHHDLLDKSSSTEYDGPELTAQQRANRLLLRDIMEKAGFSNYSKEWWHFYLKDADNLLSYDFVIKDKLKQQ